MQLRRHLWVLLLPFVILLPFVVTVFQNNVVTSTKTLPNSETNIKTTEIPFITYHYIENVMDTKDILRKSLAITPNTFDKQLTTLKKLNYKPLFVKEVPAILKSDELTEKYVALTFDDGYEDFYTDAFPLLKKHNIKATIYVVYNFIGQPNYMTKDQIKEVLNSGLVELGSHTLYHPSLLTLSDYDLSQNVSVSKQKLEELFKVRVDTFAYPYGYYDQRAIKSVVKAGYTAAVTTDERVALSSDSIFKLPRIKAGGFDNFVK